MWERVLARTSELSRDCDCMSTCKYYFALLLANDVAKYEASTPDKQMSRYFTHKDRLFPRLLSVQLSVTYLWNKRPESLPSSEEEIKPKECWRVATPRNGPCSGLVELGLLNNTAASQKTTLSFFSCYRTGPSEDQPRRLSNHSRLRPIGKH